MKTTFNNNKVSANKHFLNKYGFWVINSRINKLADDYNQSSDKEERENIRKEIKDLYSKESWNDGEREWYYDEDIEEYVGFVR